MITQFNDALTQKVFAAAADDAGSSEIEPGKAGFIEQAAIDYLNGLEVGKRLSSSPLIKVIAVDDDSVTFLIRGRMKINKGRFSPFVRIEARVLKSEPVIDEITTFIGELKFVESDLSPITEVRMGLGFDGLIFSGRGGAKVVPIGFGLDIFLGGVSDRGIMIGINVFLPVPIPLGPTGLGLNGLGGDYAHNFKPRLEAGLEAEGPLLDLETGETPDETPVGEIESPTAIHYLQWARNPDEALDRWVPAPPDETAIGIGMRAFLCDSPTAGTLLLVGPAGFAVFTPGAIIILGGEGKLLNLDSIAFEAFAVIDAASGSFALGGGVDARIPKSGALVEGIGRFDSFFSRANPTTWFVTLGTEQDPNKVKALVNFSAKQYFELNHYRVAFGLEIVWKEGFKVAKIFEVFVLGGAGIRALIGWNPRQLAGELKILAEAGFKVWKFKLSAGLTVSIWGHVPQPKVLEATTKIKLNLPFPLRDATITIKLPRERENQAPEIELPFREAENIRTGALHPLSGRQWDLVEPSDSAVDQPWPDVHVVVNFSRRVTDETGKVLGPAIAPENNGGYDVSHRLTQLDLTDVTNDEVVDGVQAVWAEGPDGDTAQLHILAQDPYSWLFWNESVSSTLNVPEPVTQLQLFGIGEDENFEDTHRFGKVRVTPAEMASLNNSFGFALPRRVITSTDLTVALRTGNDTPVAVDWMQFYVIEHRIIPTTEAFVSIEDAPFQPLPLQFTEIFPDLYLVTYEVAIPDGEAIDELRLVGSNVGDAVQAFHLYGVLFREVPVVEETCHEKVTLTPGRYRIDLAGTTSAVSLDDLAEPEDQDWSISQEFDVVFPYSLRPYLRETTVGDSRIIRDESLPWNPTLYGIGFPAYRGYLPAVRFVVPYMSKMFPTLRFQLVYELEGSPDYSFTAEPAAAADGESSLLEPSADFQGWVGCPIEADQEMEGLDQLPQSGPAEVRLIFDTPGGEATRLDSWNCYVSQFTGFAEHMALEQTTLRQIYDADGPRTISPCFTPGNIGFTSKRSIGRGRIDPPVFVAETTPPPSPASPLLPADYPILGNPTFPEELEASPLPWRLPISMTQHLGETGVPLPVAFARFARASGAVFYDVPGNPHFGLANTVEETMVEGIADNQGRLYAIWLRTPEPVDWRRVDGTLKIRHMKDDDGCSQDYAFRLPLNLTIEILPGPDASSAFIVGSFAGIRTRLPRGEYELTLSFDPSEAELPRLRPGPEIEGPEETVLLKFLQVSGQTWPLPNAAMTIPAELLQQLVAAIDPAGRESTEINHLTALTMASGEEFPITAARRVPDMLARRGNPATAATPQGRRRRRHPRVTLRRRQPSYSALD